MSRMERLYAAFSRKKIFDDVAVSPLKRVLGIFDLTALGVGSTLGVGVYVLAGEVAKTSAGPAVALSFLIAAIASMFAGICYAEFGARVPRAGSAYVYSYVSVGELVAFIIGWNLVLEYCIGAASVVRGLSTYVDSLLGNVMRNWFLSVMPMNVSFLSEYPDLFAFGVTMVFAVGLAFGMKESSLVNNIFTVLNVSVVIYVIICGCINADFHNWSLKPGVDIPPEITDAGVGGYFPFGFAGVIKGAAKCFYGFIGFDCIATAGEEAKNPKKTIPLSIVISLTIIFIAYFGISSVLTLMWPYYLQDPEAPLPFVFDQIGWYTAKWIVSIGAIFGLLASLFGSLYPLPRILYAMSSDGLLFDFLGRIHPRFSTPVWGTLVAGLVTATMAMMFDLSQLVSMMSIGTLMAYSIVAVCVALLSPTDIPEINQQLTQLPSNGEMDPNEFDFIMDIENELPEIQTQTQNQQLTQLPSNGEMDPNEFDFIMFKEVAERNATTSAKTKSSFKEVFRQTINADKHTTTTRLSERLVMWSLIAFCLVAICELSILIWWIDGLSSGDPAAITVLVLTSLVLICLLVIIRLQPKSIAELTFTVPFVPFIPGVSILINFYLMLALDAATWWRFLIWMVIGFAIYFGFGIRHSKESVRNKEMKTLVGIENMNYVIDSEENLDKVA